MQFLRTFIQIYTEAFIVHPSTYFHIHPCSAWTKQGRGRTLSPGPNMIFLQALPFMQSLPAALLSMQSSCRNVIMNAGKVPALKSVLDCSRVSDQHSSQQIHQNSWLTESHQLVAGSEGQLATRTTLPSKLKYKFFIKLKDFLLVILLTHISQRRVLL